MPPVCSFLAQEFGATRVLGYSWTMRSGFVLALAAASSIFARDAAAENDPIAVTVNVRGSGEIWLVVADGMSRPCESNDHVLYKARVHAGDVVKLASTTGSVCVDHTYGSFRETQWAGATIWSGATWAPSQSLVGSVSTDAP